MKEWKAKEETKLTERKKVKVEEVEQKFYKRLEEEWGDGLLHRYLIKLMPLKHFSFKLIGLSGFYVALCKKGLPQYSEHIFSYVPLLL